MQPKICSLKPLPLEAQFHSDRARSEQWVLSLVANRSSFLIGELLLGNLSETVVVVGNAPHDRPRFLVSHLIANRASFLCTKAPMLRIPEILGPQFWDSGPKSKRRRSRIDATALPARGECRMERTQFEKNPENLFTKNKRLLCPFSVKHLFLS
jgi:hypothetical protein